MIDLHTHTTYSDGTDTVKELLTKANNVHLEVISITNHDDVSAYKELETINIKDYYNGKIIIGCEFTTHFDNRLIEVLGYGFDYKKVNDYLNNFYNDEFNKKVRQTLFNRLINKIINNNLKYDIEVINNSINTRFYMVQIYNELIKYPENKDILNENIFNTYGDFIRKGIYNPESKLFLNHLEFKPNINEIINLIHSSGGIAFLAHPFQYRFDDTEEFLEKIYKETKLDGIECFYTTFSNEQTNCILNFAKEKNILISGGSDYHGLNKQNYDLGIGNGNLNIDKNILSNWNITYYEKGE